MTVENRLLRLLPAEELTDVLDHAERVRLRAGQVLHQFRMPMEYVYFVENGLVSVSARVEPERFVQVWLIGSEGLVGAPAVLAGGATPLHRRTVQVGGEAFRIRTADFCEQAIRLPGLRRATDRYLLMVLTQTSQAGACNAFHSLAQRLARWLLIACNSLRSSDLPLTHSMLAELLGVRRASVSECLAEMQREGILTTRRGHIRIDAPAELSGRCCDCYHLIELEYQRYLAAADNAPRVPRRLGGNTMPRAL